MKVYVAASSKEIDRAREWMRQLRTAGIIVTSTWPEIIASVGHNNPGDRTVEQYREWAMKDFGEVDAADVFWLLLPTHETIGAYIELGYAFANRNAQQKTIVMSGVHRPIFTPALADLHSPSDVDVFDILVGMKNRRQGAHELR